VDYTRWLVINDDVQWFSSLRSGETIASHRPHGIPGLSQVPQKQSETVVTTLVVYAAVAPAPVGGAGETTSTIIFDMICGTA